jgi:hypothetical protein
MSGRGRRARHPAEQVSSIDVPERILPLVEDTDDGDAEVQEHAASAVL